MKWFFFLITALFLLTGCLSHWFTETEVRLQVENKTSYTIVGVFIVSSDYTTKKDENQESVRIYQVENWIRDTIPPGERSSVVAGDWIGSFNLGVSYLKPGKDTVFGMFFENVEINGGSIFAQISEKDGFWSFDQK